MKHYIIFAVLAAIVTLVGKPLISKDTVFSFLNENLNGNKYSLGLIDNNNLDSIFKKLEKNGIKYRNGGETECEGEYEFSDSVRAVRFFYFRDTCEENYLSDFNVMMYIGPIKN